MIEEDKEFVTQYFDMPDTDFADMERMSPWLLRIELNREMLTDKGLNMSRIADTITSEFGEEMSVIFTDDNAPKHILRVSQSTLGCFEHSVLLLLWQGWLLVARCLFALVLLELLTQQQAPTKHELEPSELVHLYRVFAQIKSFC